MTSRRDANLTQNNNTTHIHTDFLKLNLEKTQKEVLQAIKDINISAEISGLTVESNDTITHEKLDTLNSNLVNKHLDSTTDSVTVNTIEGYATEETLGAIKAKTDDLTFSDNDGVIELRVFDSQNNIGLNTINDTITNKHLDSTTDSVTVNLISGFALETTQDAIKTKTDNLSFDLNGAITELITFDSRSYGKLGDVVTAINDKHLDSTTDSVTVNTITGFALESGGNLAAIKSNTDKLTSDPVLTDAIQVSIKNDILVVEPINNSINEAPYDLIINGPTLWADSLPLGNPFFADPNGREGWYYDNLSNIANKSNIYWYGNPTSGNFQENDMTFSQLSGMYSVITCDYVENGSLTIPTMGIFSQPTGTNDFLPGFAHSRWVYQLSALNLSKLRKGETLLLYTGSTRPNVHINLPSYQLSLVSINGDALSSEIIAYMTVNTQATTSKIGYLLQYCGYLNSAIGFNREYSFTNSIERLGEQNLSSLTFEQGKLIIYSAPIVSAIANKHLEFGYDKVDASGSSVSISNFPATQPVSGTVAFSNTSIEVSGTVAFSNTSIQVSSMPNLNANTDSVTIVPNGDALPVSIASTVDVSGSVSVSNFPATQPISGSISNSFTLDTTTQSSNTKLDTIHADLDGLTFDGSSNLNVNIASGSLTVDSVKIQASNGDNLTATSGSLNANITNTINTNSRTEDGSGNDITSTDLLNSKRGLDTASNLFGYAVTGAETIRTAITCGVDGKLNVNSNTKDYLGNGITSTATSSSGGATNSLDTASSLYVSNGSTRTALTATGTSLNTNITNTTLSVNATNEGFKVLDSNGNAIGGTNPLLIEGTVDVNTTTPLNISGTVVSRTQGYDPDTATYNDIYTDVDGVQRVEVVESHIISAKYVIEQDVNTIAKLVANPSTNSNAYSVDTRGREGWHFDNINITPGVASGANTLDWYRSTISAPPDLTIQKLQALYAIVCFDKLPLNAFHSYFVVTTTASTWFYYNPLAQIPSIYPGETYLLYYGQKAYQHFPEIQNASKLEMTRALNIGPGNLNETITNIQLLNIDESALNVYSYLISECGLYDQDRKNWFQVYFRNTIDFDASNNLSNLTLTGNNLNVNVANTVAVSVSNFPETQQISGNVNSSTRDGSGNLITSTAISSIRALDINVANSGNIGVSVNNTVSVSDTTSQGYLNTINQGVGYAYIEAIAINSATVVGTGSATFFTWTRGQYRRTVFNYVDSAISNTDSISILTKDSLGNGIIIATFFPYVVAGIRQFSGILELSPFNAISIRNNSSSSISAVTLKIFSA